MDKWITGICFTLLVAVCMCAASCEKYALPKLECDTDTIWAPASGGVYAIHITSNVRWSFTKTTIKSWISVDINYGEGGYVDAIYPVNVTVGPNENPDDRKCEIEYLSSTLVRNLVVEQEGTGAVTPDEPEPSTEE